MSEEILDSNINEPRKEKLINWKLSLSLALLSAIIELVIMYCYVIVVGTSDFKPIYWYLWLGYTASGFIFPIGLAMFWEAAWGNNYNRYTTILLKGFVPYLLAHVFIVVTIVMLSRIVGETLLYRLYIWGPSVLGAGFILLFSALLYFITGKLPYFRKRIKQ